ncbi:hypothetical protein ABZ354_02705 [Streptomyces sp. NPDC005925]|uniref:hypothetical protein n=1 Tax=Streptomyces sp. NPDC005925 TaxID=3157172 RepID=UPI0033FF6D80
MSADASKALKAITGSSRFEASAELSTIAQAAAALVDAYPTPTVREDVCRVYTAADAPDFDLRITWRLDDSPPKGAAAPQFTALKMGEEAGAAATSAYVCFACRGTRLPDSLGLAHIAINVRRWMFPTEPEGDIEALKDAYATVAHSVALAMAKELRCEKNGGLAERPVLDPA